MTKTQELELRVSIWDALDKFAEGVSNAERDTDAAVTEIMSLFAASKQRRRSPRTREQKPAAASNSMLPRKEDLR